jgi:hypothetical protein
MQRSFRILTGLALGSAGLMLALSTGCEWTGGGGTEQSSDTIDVPVAGVYRAPDGGLIVSSYESVASQDEITTTTTSEVARTETVAVGNGVQTAFSGTLDRNPVKSGSVTITAPPAFTLTDADGDGVLTGTAGSSGTINYSTGAFSVDFGGVAIDAGAQVQASYAFLDVEEGTTETPDREPGSSAVRIYSFTVEQDGDRIRITANTGDTFDGRLGNANIISRQQVSETEETIQESIQFTAEGIAGGVKTRIVGSFNVGVTIFFSEEIQITETTASLEQTETARTISLSMDGTWIEDTGATGDISAIGPQNERIETL